MADQSGSHDLGAPELPPWLGSILQAYAVGFSLVVIVIVGCVAAGFFLHMLRLYRSSRQQAEVVVEPPGP